MAKWERDPVLRRRLAMLLAAAEAAALTMNFYFIFSAYLRRVVVAVSASLPNDKLFEVRLAVVALAVTSVFLAGAVFQSTLYVRGRAWARSAFLIENGAIILLGLVWFIHNVTGQGEPNVFATWGGLLLPLATLFPLLWPLMSLRPQAPAGGAGSTLP